MAHGWYYLKNTGEVRGPFTGKQLREQAVSRELLPDDRVRKGTEGKWTFASHVSGLFPQASSASGQLSKAKKVPRAKVRQRLSSSSIKVRSPRDNADTKKCPYCAEEIKAAARKCKHCGEILQDETSSLEQKTNSPSKLAEASHLSSGEKDIPPKVFFGVGILCVLALIIYLATSIRREDSDVVSALEKGGAKLTWSGGRVRQLDMQEGTSPDSPKVTTDGTMVDIGKLKALESLYLFGATRVSTKGFRQLRNLDHLEMLSLAYTRFSDPDLRYLSNKPIWWLQLSSCDNITDRGMVYIKTMPKLRYLYLSRCDISNTGLVHLKNLTNLQTLDLTSCDNITDAGLAHLNGLTNLQTLDLNSVDKITDAGLAHLNGLTNLQTLLLSNCDNITDAGLVHLKALTNLEFLDLTNFDNITDAGLAHLNGLTNLQTLDLNYCDNITESDVADLRMALPNCEISRDELSF